MCVTMSEWTARHCLLFAAALVTTYSFCQRQEVEASQHEKQLYNVLLQGYSKQTRPVKRAHDTVRTWKDEYLTWNPELHGGVERLNFATGPAARIWTPDVIVFNALRTDISDYVNAVVHSGGHVTWVQPAVYTVRCRHEFRGNSWVAGFQLGSWTYDERLLDLQPLLPRGATTRGGSGSDPPGDGPPAVSAGGPRAVGGEQRDDDGVDLDVEHFSTNDHWALLDHAGTREARTTVCCDDADSESSTVYVSMHYLLKLRKKLGPSLLGRRR